MNVMEENLFKDKRLGFIIYLSVEAIMFLTLFATYMIFTPATEGPHPSDIFDAKTVALSSFFLLSSSGTLFIAERKMNEKVFSIFACWLGITLLFGFIFLGFEVNEFRGFVADGYSISTSSFLSSYYALVGLHAAHVLFGCGWMLVLFAQLFLMNTPFTLYKEKIKIFSYYWHFVDTVWIFIILIVYARYLF